MSLWEAKDGLEGVTGFLVSLPNAAVLNESPSFGLLLLAYFSWLLQDKWPNLTSKSTDCGLKFNKSGTIWRSRGHFRRSSLTGGSRLFGYLLLVLSASCATRSE